MRQLIGFSIRSLIRSFELIRSLFLPFGPPAGTESFDSFLLLQAGKDLPDQIHADTRAASLYIRDCRV